MRSLLIATLCLLTCAVVNAQRQAIGTVIGNQKVIPIATNAPGYAIDAQALIYYPDDYFLAKNASKRYPLFLFLHGAGEGASSNISEVIRQSLPQLISQGLKPYGIDPTSGDTIKFIVVSPHCASCGGSYSYPQLQYTIPYLIANYRIDTTCVWAGGLSSGGRGTFSLPMGNKVGDSLLGKKLAGIMPMANGGYDDRTDLFPNLATAVKGGMSVLYTIGDQDPGYNASGFFQYDALIAKNAQPGRYIPKVIIGGTHSANVWNPPFPETSRIFSSSVNAWTQMWTLRRKAGTAPVAVPLSASAGNNQTITLPIPTVKLTGTATPATGTTIRSYAWMKVSGGAAKISNAAAAATEVTGLEAGIYVFKLTVTSSAGTTMSPTVQVTVNPAPIPLSASAGSNQTITLPASVVTLTGTATPATGTTIKTYAWTKVSGGAATISNAAAPTTAVTGLAAGVYVFKLTVTSSAGTTISPTVQVTVNAAAAPAKPVSTGKPVPGTIQAESYDAMSGINTQASTDAGGGLNAGWIDKGDWMDYKVTVATAGTYTVNIRYASPYTNVGFQIRSSTGAVLAMVAPKTTGGFQTWGTVSTTVKLPAGDQTLRIYSISDNWNFNWIQFSSSAAAAEANNTSVDARSFSLAVDTAVSSPAVPASILVYPNPVQRQFTLSCSNGLTGKMVVQVVDVSGMVRRVYNYAKDQAVLQVSVDLGDLAAGTYFLRTQIGNFTDVKKIIKL